MYHFSGTSSLSDFVVCNARYFRTPGNYSQKWNSLPATSAYSPQNERHVKQAGNWCMCIIKIHKTASLTVIWIEIEDAAHEVEKK